MSRKELLLYSLLITIYLGGCGGEADYSFADVSPIQSGKFIDNAVEGLAYRRSNGGIDITAKGGRLWKSPT